MNWNNIFIHDQQVRSGWRFFISAALVIGAQGAVGILLGLIGVPERQEYLYLFISALTLPVLLAVFKFMTAFFDRRPLSSIGIALHARWTAELGIGLALGCFMAFSVAVMQLGLGVVRFAWSRSSPSQVLLEGSFYAALFALAATNEELMFRGYPFQRLVEAVGPGPAIVAFSALFGIVHLENPSRTWLSTLNTALVGVPLAVAYLRTRALWLPIGIHFAWNFVLGYGLGLQVSGISFGSSLLVAHVRGVTWVTGGDYGPEGSALATLAVAAGTVYLLCSRSIYISEAKTGLTPDA